MNLNPTTISPFLVVLPIRNNDKLEFRVYRKPTCKNNHIRFYSPHNTNTKRGVIINFYLRGIRTYSPKYLNDEFNYIENSFLNLLYPKLFIHFAKFKAFKIHDKNQPQSNVNTPSDKINLPHTHITLPNHSFTNIIGSNLVLKLSIHDLLLSSPRHDIISDTSVYCIPCKDCKLKYIGKMLNIHKCIEEHRRDIRVCNLNNALF